MKNKNKVCVICEMSLINDQNNYYGLLVFHYYNDEGNFVLSRLFEITHDNFCLEDFGETETNYGVKLSDTNEQIILVEKTTNLHEKSCAKKMNIENMLQKRIEDVGNLSRDISNSIKSIGVTDEVDFEFLGHLTEMIKKHKQVLNAFIETNGEQKVYETTKIKEYTIVNGIEIPIAVNMTVTWYKRTIGSRPVKVTSWEEVREKTVQLHDQYFMNDIKSRVESLNSK